MPTEQARLKEAREHKAPWKKWGPYLSERQWGTVREDYSDSGDAWGYFTHDQARSRASRYLFATSTAEQFLELGKVAGITEVEPVRRDQGGDAAPGRKR